MARLTEAEADRAYRLFYGEGMMLAGVMAELGCGLYDLSPWLTAPAIRIANAAVADERERVAARSAAKPSEGPPGERDVAPPAARD